MSQPPIRRVGTSRRRDPVSDQTVGILERMILMLQDEAQGLTPTEIVRDVVQTTGCSESAAWRTWQDRQKWKPKLTKAPEELGEAYVDLFRDLDEIRRLALNAYHSIGHPQSRIGALGKALEAAMSKIQAMQSLGVAPKEPFKVEVTEKREWSFSQLMEEYGPAIEEALADRRLQDDRGDAGPDSDEQLDTEDPDPEAA